MSWGSRCRRPSLAPGVVLAVTLTACAWIGAAFLDSRTAAGFGWANHDVANILYVGRAMRAGQRLYVDLVELNPPAIFFFSEFAANVGQWLHVSPAHVYHGLVLLLAGFGTVVIQRSVASTRRPAAALLVGLSYLLVLLGGGLPGVQEFTHAFGQREQIFALVFLPYLVWRLEGGPHAPTTSLMLCLLGYLSTMKPHFMVLVGTVELVCWLDSRRVARRAWAELGAGALLPLMLLLLHSPRSVVALYTETIRYHLAGAYSYFDQPYPIFLRSTPHRWLLGYAVALAYVLWPCLLGGTLPRRTRIGAVLLPLVAYALVVQQHKFWEYHSIVVVSLVVVLTYYLLATLLPRLPRDRARALFWLATAALVVQLGAAMARFAEMTREWKRGERPDVLDLAPVLQGRHRVLYYSTSIQHMQLAFFLRQRIVGRWCHDATYPSIVRQPDPEQRRRRLDAYCAEQRELIRRQQPEAIVFDATGQGLTATDPDLFDTLVGRCAVVPLDEYVLVSTELERAAVFLHR